MLDADTIREEAQAILREGLKKGQAVLTENQRTVFSELAVEGNNVLYIDRTGAGKSETYFIAARFMRKRDPRAGPVIVVTPLVALIHDQVRRAKAFGLNAEGFFSAAKGMSNMQRDVVLTKIKKNTLDLLFLTAEMLNEISEDMVTRIIDGKQVTYEPKLLGAGPALKLHPPDLTNASWTHVPLLVIDEIHYIAEAGHDFRLAYSGVWNKFSSHQWYQDAKKLGLTATVNERVRSSIVNAIPSIAQWTTVLGSLYRENIAIRVISRPASDKARLDYVRQLAEQNPDHNILVFCKEVKHTRDHSTALSEAGINSGFYSSTTRSPEDAKQAMQNEADFRKGTIRVLFSTCALGLGYDKSDIHHVVHMWSPNSLVQYYQEMGRAGRSEKGEAVAHLLPTSPWISTGWVAILSDICWFLRKEGDEQELELIKDRSTMKYKLTDTERAIELGIAKRMLLQTGTKLQLVNAKETILELDKQYAAQMKDDFNAMQALSHNCSSTPTCLWRFILSHFEGNHNLPLTCNKCSHCKPEGDILPDLLAGGDVYYELLTPTTNLPILALHKYGEPVLIDEERIKTLFTVHRPSMVVEPSAKWTLVPLPDSTGDNFASAEYLAGLLNGMEVNKSIIAANPDETRKVKKAKSPEERRDILKAKFTYDREKMPAAGNILIYDDNCSSGDTIDAVVKTLRSFNGSMEFAAIVMHAFPNKRLESRVVPTSIVLP